MPNVTVTLSETEQSVFRPVIVGIIDQVKAITKMSKDTQIFFPGDIQTMQTPGASIDSKTERYAIFNAMNVAFIEVQENYSEDDIATTAVSRKEQLPVFKDPKLGIYIAPVYSHNDVSINFRYRCKSKTEALRWRDDIRMRVSNLRDINLHTVEYHYPLPVEYLRLLQDIHRNIEAVDGYGLTFPQYVKSHSTQRLTLIGDLVNQNQRLVITETQARIIGFFDFDVVPEKPEREDSEGTWVATFAYNFSYDKPIGCNMRYPVMVHNQLLAPEYTTYVNGSYDLDVIDKSYPMSRHALNAFETDTIMNTRRNPNPYIRLPHFDDYVLPSTPVATGSVFVALTEVDEDKRTLLNLADLGDITIDPDIYKFMVESELPYLTKLYYSVLHFSLYKGNELAGTDALEIDSSLNLKATSDLSYRINHRVRLSLVVDFTRLTRDAVIRLKQYPKAFVKIISSLDQVLRDNPDFQGLFGNRDITNVELSAVYEILTGVSFNNGRSVDPDRYLGPGLPLNQWGCNPNRYRNGYPGNPRWIFNNIDPRLVKYYRENRIKTNTVLVTGVVAVKSPTEDKPNC
jgi:hypothetical protein